MGATMAHLIGKVFHRSWPDCRVLLAAGAGAGLATAFNAPIAGAVFVLEELVRRFEPRIAIVALRASATAISVSRMLLGDVPDFHVEALDYPGAETRPLYFVHGAAAGLVAIVYNRTLLATLAVAERLARLPVELRAGLIGAAVGTLAWFRPDLVGGGDAITQRALLGAEEFATLPCCSCSGSGSARFRTPRRRRVGCLRPCLCSARNSACSSDSSFAWRFQISAFSPRDSPSSAWRPSLPEWCGLL
jgi:chloride channel protein, CIC family